MRVACYVLMMPACACPWNNVFCSSCSRTELRLPPLTPRLLQAGRPVTPELAATLRAIEERVGRDLSALLSREGADIVYEALEDRGAESVAQSLDLCGALAGLALDRWEACFSCNQRQRCDPRRC